MYNLLDHLTLIKWLGSAAKRYDDAWSNLYLKRSEQNQNTGLAVPPSEREEQLDKLRQATVEIHDSVLEVIRQLEETGGPTLDGDFNNYCGWSCEVGRYSFGWHLTTGV